MNKLSMQFPNIAQSIKAKRQRDHLTLREAGAESGVHYSTLCRTEAGKTPDLATLVKVAEWTGERIGDLLKERS